MMCLRKWTWHGCILLACLSGMILFVLYCVDECVPQYAVSLGNDPLCPASKFGRQMSTQLKSHGNCCNSYLPPFRRLLRQVPARYGGAEGSQMCLCSCFSTLCCMLLRAWEDMTIDEVFKKKKKQPKPSSISWEILGTRSMRS